MSLSNASIVRLSNSQLFKDIRRYLGQQDIVGQALAIQQIAAPTFYEDQRAAYVEAQFKALGLQGVARDDLHNVYGWLPSPDPDGPILAVSAHTDTVFPPETALTTRHMGDKLYGPGIGDNSMGVAGLFLLADIFRQFNLPQQAQICLVANTREEGLGDLGGIKAAIDHLGERLKAAIVVEGAALGHLYHVGIAVRRYKISVSAPGGHSWLHFGNPSAIHALMNFGASLTTLDLPSEPRSTYNIGMIEGGSSINTIASHAHCYLDLRSAQTQALLDLESQVRQLAAQHSPKGVNFLFEQVGDRPAGAIPENHPLVQLAKQALHAIGITPEIEAASTDANAFLERGIPAVCMGLTFGANAHTLEEYIETAPIADGVWQLALLTCASANALAAW